MSYTYKYSKYFGSPKTVDDVPPLTCLDCDFRTEFLTMYLCAKRKGMLDNPFHKDVIYSKDIESNGTSVYDCGHSGATETYCARLIEFVSKYGWKAFVLKFGTPKNQGGSVTAPSVDEHISKSGGRKAIFKKLLECENYIGDKEAFRRIVEDMSSDE